MARPRLAQRPVVYSVRLSLRPGEDDDLIDWLNSIPSRGRARAIVSALRAGGLENAPVDDDLVSDDEALDALEGLFF